MSERRLSTICAVVERPDHHCGDDLIKDISSSSETMVSQANMKYIFEECDWVSLGILELQVKGL